MVVICLVLGQMRVGTMKLCPESGPLHYTAHGESLESNAPRLDDSIFEFIKDKNNNEEYAYIWSLNNEWKCVKMNQFNDNDPEFVEIPAGPVA